MQLLVEKKELLEKLGKVQYVHEKKSTLDITSCVLLKAQGKEIKIVATDLETNFRDFCPAKITDDGAIAVNSRKLIEIVRGARTEDITLKVLPEENVLVVESARSVFRLPIRSPEDFPYTPFFDDEKLAKLDARLMKAMIDKVVFSVPIRKARSNVPGLMIRENIHPADEEDGNSIRSLEIFSVDLHRMVRIEKEFNYDGSLDLSEGIVLPKRSAQELSKVLEGVEVFEMGALENFLVARESSCTLTMRLLNFEIPRIDIKVLTETPYNFQIDREVFLEILKRIAVMTSDDYRHIMVHLSNSRMNFSVNNPGVGTADEDYEVNYSGPNMSFAFNIRYLIEALSNMQSEIINVGIIKEKAPFIFTGEKDEGYISVLMPLVLIGNEGQESSGEEEF